MNIKEWIAGARHSMTMKVNALITAAGGLLSNAVEVLAALSNLLEFFVPAARAYMFDFQSMIDPELFKTIGTVLMFVGLINMFLRAKTTKPIMERKPETEPKPPIE